MRYAEFRNLETPRLILRRITAEDVPAYFHRLFGSRRVAEFMLWEPHTEIAQSAAAVQKVLARYENGNYYRWGIAQKQDNSLIGIIELLRFDEEKESCSFAYMLGEAVWGRGYGTEAVRAAFKFAFEDMGISSITADHFAENLASGAVMRRAGMRHAGTLPRKYEKNGVWHDAEVYCITQEEWKAKTRY